MSVSFQQVTIDGESYTIQQVTAAKSLRLLTRLAKVIGPAMAEFAMKDGFSKTNKSVEDSLSRAVPLLFDRLDENQIIETVGLILEGTIVDGRSINTSWETRFMGKLPSLFRVLQESLKVQFGDFSNVLTLIASRAQAMGMGTASSVPTTSNGPSGE